MEAAKKVRVVKKRSSCIDSIQSAFQMKESVREYILELEFGD